MAYWFDYGEWAGRGRRHPVIDSAARWLRDNIPERTVTELAWGDSRLPNIMYRDLQVVSVFAGTSGALDDLPVGEVRRFERELHEWMQARYSGMLGEIRDTGKLPEGDTLAIAGEEFHGQFVATLESETEMAVTAAATAAVDAAAADGAETAE